MESVEVTDTELVEEMPAQVEEMDIEGVMPNKRS